MARPSGDEVVVRGGFTLYIEQVAQELGVPPAGNWAVQEDGAWEAYVGIPALELYPGGARWLSCGHRTKGGRWPWRPGPART